MDHKEFTISIDTPATLNDGGWHHASIEHDAYNIRYTVDMKQKLIEIPQGIEKVSNFGGILYIGGVASDL